MGTLADSLFSVLMSWVRALVNSLWALLSGDRTTILEFFGKNWLMIAVVIVAAGIVIDWTVWLLRWQPYHLWAQRVRRLLRLDAPEAEEKQSTRAHAAVRDNSIYQRPVQQTREVPLYVAQIEEEEEDEAIRQADQVPDEALGAYPGMRYDSGAGEAPKPGDTHRYAAVSSEGPGAAEVSRRRAEIDAWQQQMKDEAREDADRKAGQARLEREAHEAEQARLEREAHEAEQARLEREAQEAERARLEREAQEAEQARLAQEAYERELAEYEMKKAQYERELAEYERQKAEYEAETARRAKEQEDAARAYREEEASEQNTDEVRHPTRRRRQAQRSYSDYIGGETVEQLPPPPAWPEVDTPAAKRQDKPQKPVQKGEKKGLLGRLGQMIEPEEEEVPMRVSLPPRVDPKTAYRPAKAPQKGGKKR